MKGHFVFLPRQKRSIWDTVESLSSLVRLKFLVTEFHEDCRTSKLKGNWSQIEYEDPVKAEKGKSRKIRH